MPLGSSKISLGGADLVPGGNSTFNSSGTFVAPLGVSLVCATGFGGVGGTGDVGRGGNGGGGGGGGYPPTGGSGGSGIVIVAYPMPLRASGGNISYFGRTLIHTFLSSGNLCFCTSPILY